MWKDTTSWSRSDSAEARQTPRTWTWDATPGFSLVVTRYHGITGWVLHCHRLGLNCHPLARGDIEGAKAEAIRIVKAEVERIAAGLP